MTLRVEMGILMRVFNLLKKLGLGGVGEWRRGRRAGQASTASPPLHYLQPTSLISIGIGISLKKCYQAV